VIVGGFVLINAHSPGNVTVAGAASAAAAETTSEIMLFSSADGPAA